MATALALATPPVAPPAPVPPANSSCVCTSTATTCKSGAVTLKEEDCGCQQTLLTDGTVKHWCYVVNPDTCPEADEARIAARAHDPPTPQGPAAVKQGRQARGAWPARTPARPKDAPAHSCICPRHSWGTRTCSPPTAWASCTARAARRLRRRHRLRRSLHLLSPRPRGRPHRASRRCRRRHPCRRPPRPRRRPSRRRPRHRRRRAWSSIRRTAGGFCLMASRS